jgi:carotenoid cleavage dioxygenase-like enzyme
MTILVGNYAPVHDELEVAELAVTGVLPPQLDGLYVRNGANPAFPPLGRYHLFDGDGMLHGVELRGGRAGYRNRFVESKGLRAERRAGRALFGGLGEYRLPEPELVAEAGLFKNTANTNIVRHAGRYLALMEGALPTEVDAGLATVGEYDFGGALVGAMTAHPKVDPTTGEMLFFGYSPLPPYLRYHVVDAAGRLVRSVEIDLPAPVMMHDFVVTDGHVVLFDLPASFDLEAMLAGHAFVTWRPERGARIGVLPRDGGGDDVTWIEVDPCYVFHFLNGWDGADGTVVVDGCRAARLPTAFGDEVLTEPVRPSLHRWTIDPAAGTVREEQLDDQWAEFPRVADSRAGLPNRYGYAGRATRWEAELVQFTGVVKWELETGRSWVHHYGDTCEAGEAVFAPDPEGTGEDAGWLLNLVYDRATDRSELVVLDAGDLDAEPVARVHLPRRVPFGFHGNWLAGPA